MLFEETNQPFPSHEAAFAALEELRDAYVARGQALDDRAAVVGAKGHRAIVTFAPRNQLAEAFGDSPEVLQTLALQDPSDDLRLLMAEGGTIVGTILLSVALRAGRGE